MSVRSPGLGFLALVTVLALGVLFRFERRGAAPLRPEVGPSTLPETSPPPRASPDRPLDRRPFETAPLDEDRAARSNTPASPSPVDDSPALPVPARAAGFAPPGTIEGVVLRGSDPVGGGEAWMKRSSIAGEASAWTDAGPQAADERVRVGADGVFRFFPSRPGVFLVGVDVEPGLSRVASIRLPEDFPSLRWVISLGSSEIRGHVWREDGSPASDATVRLAQSTHYCMGKLTLPTGSTRTEVDGSYRLTGLDPGSYELELDFDRTFGATGPLGVDLGTEVKTIDFGSPRGLRTWSGRLLTSNGAALPLATEIVLENRELGTTLVVPTEMDGSFHSKLATGSYVLRIELTRLWNEIDVGTLVMEGHDLVQDLQLPGAWLAVSVRTTGATLRPDEASDYGVILQKRGTSSTVLACSRPSRDGRCHFLGVPPGEYEVSTNGKQRERINVREGESEILVELTAGDP